MEKNLFFHRCELSISIRRRGSLNINEMLSEWAWLEIDGILMDLQFV